MICSIQGLKMFSVPDILGWGGVNAGDNFIAVPTQVLLFYWVSHCEIQTFQDVNNLEWIENTNLYWLRAMVMKIMIYNLLMILEYQHLTKPMVKDWLLE